MLCCLAKGIQLRAKIVVFLKSPDAKLGPINYLIWVDQVNGVFLGVSIFLRVLMIASPVPLSSLLGEDFCTWADFLGLIYLGGSYIWGSGIALFRALFIKCQRLIRDRFLDHFGRRANF
jgi:hypothetical protein